MIHKLNTGDKFLYDCGGEKRTKRRTHSIVEPTGGSKGTGRGHASPLATWAICK